MKARIENRPKTNNSEAYSQIIIIPETNEEAAELRWMEEVFDMNLATIVPRYLGHELSYAIIPKRK